MIRFRVISGTINVTENCYLYEYLPDGKTVTEMILVDCGVAFPELGMHGVDLIIPDFSYIVENKHLLKGIIVSQGHEDHQGALPFLLKDVKVPVYAPKLVVAFIEDKFVDYQLTNYSLNGYDPGRDVLTLGSFKVTPFRVSHSIPETVGFAIDTPEGRFFHVAEHKFDPAPASGSPFDIAKATELAKSGVVALFSDCIGVNTPGSIPPESSTKAALEKIIANAKQAIFFTCISSSISRIQAAIELAAKYNRKVAFIGRSIERKSIISHQYGFLKYDEGQVVSLREANNMSPQNIMYIIAGAFGQVGSSLYRAALSEHKFVRVNSGDTAILEQDPAPPHTKESIDFVVDNLIDLGLDVHYYDLGEGLHVSGHGAKDDIKKLFDIVRPKYFVPIGGTIRFMHGYRNLVGEWGGNTQNVFALKPGEAVDFAKGQAVKGPRITVKQVLVDGSGIGDVGKSVLSDRQSLSENGFVVAIIKLNAQNKIEEVPEIVSRGFVFEKDSRDFLAESGVKLQKVFLRLKKTNPYTIKYKTAEYLSQYFFEHTKRRPLIIPVVIMT